MVHISLVPTLDLMVFYVSTFQRMCAVPNMAVFCSSRTSWLPGMLPMYSLNDFEMVPVAPFITGITVVFTFHVRWISIVRFLYFKIFSASLLLLLYITNIFIGSKHCLTLLETVDLCRPNRYFRNFSSFNVGFKCHSCPSVRCTLVANAINSDTEVFNGNSVLINDMLVSDTFAT